jgi:wobble nucleotide-excising tRNase
MPETHTGESSKTPPITNPNSSKGDKYDCTFCPRTFSSEEFWSRHEKTHLFPIFTKSTTKAPWWGGFQKPREKLPDRSRCEFCGTDFTTWTSRKKHVAAHFRQGKRKIQWEGEWGLLAEWMEKLKGATMPEDRPGKL